MTIYDDLLKQYNRACGTYCKTIYDKEFNKWLDQYSNDLKAYIEFLESHGYEFKKSNIAELDKGPYDSILVRRQADHLADRLITENASVIHVPMRKLRVAKKEIKIFKDGRLDPTLDFDAYMSYNLTLGNQLNRFSTLHNIGKDVIYGVFGKIGDRDQRNKLEEVQTIYKYMDDLEFNLDYKEADGSYFYMVGSK